MGRHSRRGPAPQGSPSPAGVVPAESDPDPDPEGPGRGRRRRAAAAGDEAAYGTPAHGTPVYGGTPAHGVPRVRGGHPEQREAGGGWGTGQRYGDWQGAAPRRPGPHGAGAPGATPGPRTPGAGTPGGTVRETGAPGPGAPGGGMPGGGVPGARGPGSRGPGAGTLKGARPGARVPLDATPAAGTPLIPGPRREFIDAFDADAFDAPGARTGVREAAPPGRDGGGPDAGPDTPEQPEAEQPAKGSKGRALTGIAAAAVTTVLAVVVAGQVTGGEPSGARAADGLDRAEDDIASRSDGRAAPSAVQPDAPVPPPTYAELMTRQFPLDPQLTASGRFTAVPGLDRAPGKGQKFRYRVDIENGLGLDGALFADAVQKTLNDERSWAHDGAMTFERVSSGKPDFVITLASPGTTGVWCAKSGLDTTVDNVSCDSASTDRVMINAFRWAQGSKTFGAKAMLGYRQMLINHEVGHRLGHNHVICRTPGALAPVMQQQTKSLDIDGIKCRPNPWVFPNT
ncbi:DUF3152 domain-containing protein [Streptomyces odonnellii]|uniref:DUF3152 domain-containing protein n=1 Tax=Streptomyces odonnellii TaxID=1417980 RepID=UPI000626A68E